MCGRLAIMHHGELIALEPTAALLERMGGRELVVQIEPVLTELPAVLQGRGAQLSAEGHRLIVPLAQGENVADLLARLSAAGLTVTDLETRRAGLEEVFLQLTAGKPRRGA